ncbi:MAG: hypothetical protein KDA36_05655, partial [Planctomycetaceae bacterium]|nr:hypothetical protein [Planctomycetaceae bacterium]
QRFSCPLGQILNGRELEEKFIPIVILSLDDRFRIVFLGAEPSNLYVRKLRNLLGNNTLVVGYFEEVYGYLPTENQLPEGGYEVKGFQNSFNMDGDFLPGFEEALLEMLAN